MSSGVAVGAGVAGVVAGVAGVAEVRRLDGPGWVRSLSSAASSSSSCCVRMAAATLLGTLESLRPKCAFCPNVTSKGVLLIAS